MYRDFNPDALGEPAAGDEAPPSDDIAAQIERNAREWDQWFAGRLAAHLADGEIGTELLWAVGEMIKERLAPLQRKLDRLERQQRKIAKGD